MKSSVICIVLLSATMVASASAQRVALINQVAGEASVERNASSTELELFDRLELGDRIRCLEGCRLVVAFFDGRRVELIGPAEAVLGEGGVEMISGELGRLESVSTLPRISAIAEADAPSAKAGAVRVRDAGNRVALRVWPGDGELSLAGGTILQFEDAEAIAEYQIQLENEAAEVIFKASSNGESVTVPADLLAPSSNYYWRVQGKSDRIEGHGDAYFSTLDAETDAALEACRDELVEDPGEALLLAEIERSLGLLREACATLASQPEARASLDCPRAPVER